MHCTKELDYSLCRWFGHSPRKYRSAYIPCSLSCHIRHKHKLGHNPYNTFVRKSHRNQLNNRHPRNTVSYIPCTCNWTHRTAHRPLYSQSHHARFTPLRNFDPSIDNCEPSIRYQILPEKSSQHGTFAITPMLWKMNKQKRSACCFW